MYGNIKLAVLLLIISPRVELYCDPCACIPYKNPHTILCESTTIFSFPQYIPQAINDGIGNITIKSTSIAKLPTIDTATYPSVFIFVEMDNPYLSCDAVFEWLESLPPGCQAASDTCDLSPSSIAISSEVVPTHWATTQSDLPFPTIVLTSPTLEENNTSIQSINPTAVTTPGDSDITHDYATSQKSTSEELNPNSSLTTDAWEITTTSNKTDVNSGESDNQTIALVLGVIVPTVSLVLLGLGYLGWKRRTLKRRRGDSTTTIYEQDLSGVSGDVFELGGMSVTNPIYSPSTMV